MLRLLTLGLVSLISTATLAQEQSPLFRLLSPSANSGGKYNNPIPNIELTQAFTEICFGNGQVRTDQHPEGGATPGGHCRPGDTGWIIEQNQREGISRWVDAKVECLTVGMRLPEPFEYLYSCENSAEFGLSDMIGEFEWASNDTLPYFETDNTDNGLLAFVIGRTACADGRASTAIRDDEIQRELEFRCAL